MGPNFKRKRKLFKKLTNKLLMIFKPKKTRSTLCLNKRTNLNNKLMTSKPTWNKKRNSAWISKTTNNVSKKNSRNKNSSTTNFPPNLKMNKHLLRNSKRKSRNFKPELKSSKKNSKPNVLPEPRSKNNALNSPENSKSSLKDSKKQVVPPLPKLNSTNAVSPRWLNSDVISKNPTWLTNLPSLLFARNKLTKSANFLSLLIISNVSSRSSRKKSLK